MKKIKPVLNILKNAVTVTVPFYVTRITAHAGNYDFLGNTGIRDENIDRLGRALKMEGAGLYSACQVLGIAGIMCALALAGTAVAMSHNAKDRGKQELAPACMRGRHRCLRRGGGARRTRGTWNGHRGRTGSIAGCRFWKKRG